MIKEVNIQISVKHYFIEKEKKILQAFAILGPKKNYKYLFDPRFVLSDKFKEKIKDFSLSNIPSYIFLNKIEEESKIVLEFETESRNPLSDFFFTISDFVPTTFGCDDCRFFIEQIDEKVKCEFFKKYVKKRKGSCRYFRQKKLFKT